MSENKSIPLLTVNSVVQLETNEYENYYILNNETSVTDSFEYYKCRISNVGSGLANKIKFYD